MPGDEVAAEREAPTGTDGGEGPAKSPTEESATPAL